MATGMEALHKHISDKFAPKAASNTQPGGGGASSAPDVLNPRVVPTKGRPAGKRKKSATERRGG